MTILLIPLLGLYRWWIEAALQVRAARDQFTLAGRGVPLPPPPGEPT
ncbi:hypothetical protein ACQKO5_18925 [Novosphingobium subterraneum]